MSCQLFTPLSCLVPIIHLKPGLCDVGLVSHLVCVSVGYALTVMSEVQSTCQWAPFPGVQTLSSWSLLIPPLQPYTRAKMFSELAILMWKEIKKACRMDTSLDTTLKNIIKGTSRQPPMHLFVSIYQDPPRPIENAPATHSDCSLIPSIILESPLIWCEGVKNCRDLVWLISESSASLQVRSCINKDHHGLNSHQIAILSQSPNVRAERSQYFCGIAHKASKILPSPLNAPNFSIFYIQLSSAATSWITHLAAFLLQAFVAMETNSSQAPIKWASSKQKINAYLITPQPN